MIRTLTSFVWAWAFPVVPKSSPVAIASRSVRMVFLRVKVPQVIVMVEIVGQPTESGSCFSASRWPPDRSTDGGLTRHDSFKGAWRVTPNRNTCWPLRFRRYKESPAMKLDEHGIGHPGQLSLSVHHS